MPEERQDIIESHRKLVLQLRDLEQRIETMVSANDPHWRDLEEERSRMVEAIEPLVNSYWQWIPAVELSKCPFCRVSLAVKFDTYDLNGFWWMDRTQRPHDEPPSCEHFCLLSGALSLNDQPVKGGLFPCKPGPDKPFVYPRLLQMPAMVVVISELPMTCGYKAYPIAYYSKQPVQSRVLTQSWARKEHTFTLDDGTSGWDIKDDTQDFDLKFWIGSSKVLMYREGDVVGLKDNDHIAHVAGFGINQTIVNDELSFESHTLR